MANTIASYFFAPSWDYPRDGPIKIGNVITSIKQPEQPLYNAPLPPGGLVSSEKRGVEFSEEKLRGGKFGVWVRFLSVIGIDVGGSLNKSNSQLFEFDRIETTQFIPTPEYIAECALAPPVAQFLELSRYRKPVYLITGLKIAIGSKAKLSRSRERTWHINAEVDGTIPSGGSVPVGAGQESEVTRVNESYVCWEESDDFVFAFRMWKIKVEKKTGVTRGQDFTKGAMLSAETQTRIIEVPFTIVGVEEVGIGETSLERDLMEDEDGVACVVPKVNPHV
ncbi:hypothetical protein GGR58DRAFT_450638 [Xylaria digitata]|nr:hypothetical protein GGR58DRAFT_450638 [Xylaria digitata]